MKLQSGSRVGVYEIQRLIGSGGMGQVYEGSDLRLNRNVAIKVLAEAFANDSARMTRFEREAKLLASLNHPNIASIYGIEESDGHHALVMELIEGKTLAETLNKQPLSFEEVLPIIRQMVDAIEFAHEHGVIHRDLKPSNIKLRDDGTVKILDFGLAKAVSDEMPDSDASVSPTISQHATSIGMILGTAAYMSPEQAKGKAVDKRADIWSFGVILFEMLSGQRPFAGDTVSEALASVLKEEPNWALLPQDLPPSILQLIKQCLAKDSKKRLRDIGDARLQLDNSNLKLSLTEEKRSTEKYSWIRFLPLMIALLVVIAFLFTKPWQRKETSNHRVQQFALSFPAELPLVNQSSSIQLSPDGSTMAYITGTSQNPQLAIRELKNENGIIVPETDGAKEPFFSFDGKKVAFFSQGNLKRVSISADRPQVVCAAGNPRGGAWGYDDKIYLTPNTDSPIVRVHATGGKFEPVTFFNTGDGERSHRWPQMLPGGKAMLFTIAYSKGTPLDDASIAIQRLDEKPHSVLLRGAGFGRYVSSGHIIYAHKGSLFAVPFDLNSLRITGDSFRVQDEVVMSATNGSAQVSITDSGHLLYVEGAMDRTPVAPLYLVDRSGSERILIQEPRGYVYARFTKDRKTLLMEIDDPASSVWAYSLTRGTLSLLTRDQLSYEPVPSPDQHHVVYESVQNGTAGIFLNRIDGNAEQRLTSTKEINIPTSWSPDGKILLFTSGSSNGRSEIWMILIAEKKIVPLIQGSFNAGAAVFSPDGKWIAYVSDESKRNEIYVRSFPHSDIRLQISTEGGIQPLWAPSGKELFFRAADKMMAVDFKTNGEPLAGQPRLLFKRFYSPNSSGFFYDMIANYDVTLDAQEFVMQGVSSEVKQPLAHLILNWSQHLLDLQSK